MWKRKQIEDYLVTPEEGHPTLKRSLNGLDLVMLGIGAIIGAGLFSITGIAAAGHAGPAILISFVIAALGCLFAALCYSELASMFPIAGSAYTYAHATMGEFIAWIIGWDLILEYAIGASAVAISWSAYVVSFLHDLGISLPEQLIASPWQSVMLPNGSEVYGVINLPAVLILVLLTSLLILGIRQSSIVNTFIVLLKVAVVILFIALGISYTQADNYVPFIPENTGVFGEYGWSGIFRAAGIVFFAYIGFDAVSTAAQETKNPQKALPFGILGSLAICTVLYILFSYVLVGLANYKELNNPAPVAVALQHTPYAWVSTLVKLAIIAGFSSVMLVLLLGQSRIFYSMSVDGLLPKVFSKIHPRFRTPWLSNLILLLFVSAFAGFMPLSVVGHMTSIGTLLAFVIVCLGVIILRYTRPEYPRTFRTPWVPYVPILGIIVCSLMMFSLGVDTWIRLITWLAIGFIIYFSYSRKRSVH